MPLQSENDCSFQRRNFDAQGVPIQSRTRGDEIVRRPKGKFHRFLQGAHLGIKLSFYYVYQGPLANRFPTVPIHVKMRDFKNLLGQVLGDVQ